MVQVPKKIPALIIAAALTLVAAFATALGLRGYLLDDWSKKGAGVLGVLSAWASQESPREDDWLFFAPPPPPPPVHEVAGMGGAPNEIDAPAAAPVAHASKKTEATQPAAPAAPPAGVISKSLLAGWAAAGALPQVKAVAASGELPAGLELVNPHVFGAGFQPGDRLVAIDGQAVSAPMQAAGLILMARARKAAQITGTVARQTEDGVARYQVAFMQPYGEDLPAHMRQPETSSGAEPGAEPKGQE